MHHKKSVLVLDGETRIGLEIVRSLGKKGIRVHVGSRWKHSRSAYSRYTYDHHVYPELDNPKRFNDALFKIIRKTGCKVIFPLGYSTISHFVRNSKNIRKYAKIIPIPSISSFNLVNDKSSLTKISGKYGIECPITFFPKDLSEIFSLSNILPYPVIIKPRISCGSKGIVVVKDISDLKSGVRQYQKMVPDSNFFDYNRPIVQKFRPSCTTSIYILMHNGEIKADMMFQNLWHHPYPLGTVVRCKTIEDMALRFKVENMLKGIGYEGLSCISFIRDPDDNRLKLIDFNPRAAILLGANISVGMDFPYILYNLALEGDIGEIPRVKTGLVYSYLFFGEIAKILFSKNKLKDVENFLNEKKYAYNFDISDPLPFLIQISENIRFRNWF